MPGAADLDFHGADVYEAAAPDDKVKSAVELAMEASESVPPVYDLGEIGVDEMEPPSPTAQAALDSDDIEPSLFGAGSPAAELPPDFSAPSRTSPPPDGVFPSREAKSPRANATGAANGAANGQHTETRARAEEVNGGAKIVPKIEEPAAEFLGVYLEVESWFSTFDGSDVVQWLDEMPEDEDAALLRRLLRPCPGRRYTCTSELLREVVASALALLDDGRTLRRAAEQLPTAGPATLTLLYVLLVVHYAEHRAPLLAEGVPLVAALMHRVAGMRWSVFFDDSAQESHRVLSQLFMLCRVAALATFGGAQAHSDTAAEVWQQYGLAAPAAGREAAEYASPLNYASFLHSITKRFPTFVPPEDEEALRAHHRRMDVRLNQAPDPHDPRELVSALNSVVPYVPHSIVEACELFKARVQATPQVLQLWEEQERAQHVEVPRAARGATAATSAVTALYRAVSRVQKSFVQVIVEFAMHHGSDAPTPGLHAALATAWLLLQWFDVTHVLMGEFLAALLFDCQFHLMAHSFCGSHGALAQTLLAPYAVGGAWAQLAGASAVDDSAPRAPDRGTQLVIESFNHYNLKTYTYLLGITRLVVLNKTQRTLVVAELPVDAWKPMFGVYERDLWAQLLQLLKLQVPFNGKRWRYLNMEIISAIYLYCPSKLDDDWLSGADVSQSVKDAPAQEQMLRALIEMYNARLLAAEQ